MRRDSSTPRRAGAPSERVTGEPGPLRRFDFKGLGDIVYECRGEGEAEVAVVIPLYN